jgi:hypothetical protein
MRSACVEALRRLPTYERIEDGSILGGIRGCAGHWVSAETEGACRRKPRDAREGWLTLPTTSHTPLPLVRHSSQG